MRILTVRQPWAWAIIHGGKDVENRPKNIAGGYRGPVAIHAGLAYDHTSHVISPTLREAQDKAAVAAGAETYPGGYLWDIGQPDPREAWSVAGAIIGVVDLVDVHIARAAASGRLVDWAEHTKPGEQCSPWAEWDAHHLVFGNPRALDAPIPYRGALGLRKTNFGIEEDWLVEYHEPCKHPCAGPEYGCPPSCHMDALARLEPTA